MIVLLPRSCSMQWDGAFCEIMYRDVSDCEDCVQHIRTRSWYLARLSCAPLLPIQWMSHTQWNHKCVFHTKFTLHITHSNIDEFSDEHWLSPEVVLIHSLSQRHHVEDCNFRRNCTFCCARKHAGCCKTCVWTPPSKKGMECCLQQLPEQLLWSVHLQVFCYMLAIIEPVTPTREWSAKTHHSTLWHHRYCG